MNDIDLVVRGKRGDFNDYEKLAAAEKAAAEVVRLTPQELRMIDELDGKIKPFYDQTLF